jgi:hypothetical protein
MPALVRESAVHYHTDYLAQEAQNSSLGRAGEEFVLLFEKARLINEGRDALANKIEHVALTVGPSAGFDIRSFEADGKDRFIEVKTTAYGELTPFYVTRNELEASRGYSANYHLYRAFAFRSNPKLFAKAGALDRSFSLDPMQFVARVS